MAASTRTQKIILQQIEEYKAHQNKVKEASSSPSSQQQSPYQHELTNHNQPRQAQVSTQIQQQDQQHLTEGHLDPRDMASPAELAAPATSERPQQGESLHHNTAMCMPEAVSRGSSGNPSVMADGTSPSSLDQMRALSTPAAPAAQSVAMPSGNSSQQHQQSANSPPGAPSYGVSNPVTAPAPAAGPPLPFASSLSQQPQLQLQHQSAQTSAQEEHRQAAPTMSASGLPVDKVTGSQPAAGPVKVVDPAVALRELKESVHAAGNHITNLSATPQPPQALL